MMMMMMSNQNQNQNVFTAAQWDELEQQALIYKYMVSGVPVPTDLILAVRRSLYNNSSSSSLSTQPTLWEGSFQYNQLYQLGGYGRKIDLEPGRCRRTDGKKWRCSKEAFPDSKYCERHMHRGRNRSRKPVEFSSSSSSSSLSSTATTTLNVSSSSSSTTINKSDPYPPLISSIQTSFMDSSPYYRQLQGVKDLGMDERSAYFQLNDPYSTSMTQKISSSDHHHNNYSHFNFQNLKDDQVQKKEGGQHCFVMGTDFIKPSQESTKKVDEISSSKQPFHHFFSPPPKPTVVDPNWVEVDHPKAPLSTQDLFQSKPRPYW